LSDTGLRFAASGYRWPPAGGYRILGPIRKNVRFLVGYAHILAGFLWFGTILYVHLLLRPAYASKGLPRGEMALGMVSMAVVGITGILLTISKIVSLDVLFQSPWGRWLTVKIILYGVMVSSAAVVVVFVGPRLKRGGAAAGIPTSGVFDPATLSACDGCETRPAYVAYEGYVYDMGNLNLWKGGVHMKHRAGTDLTAALAKAPHGDEKLAGLPVVGRFDASKKPPLNTAQKAFYVIAYMNLALVFAVLFVIAYWRWGI